MSDFAWGTKTIRELGAGNGPTVQTGPFGSQLHAEDYVEDGVPFILIRNIGEGGLNPGDLPRISFADAKRLARYSLKPGDIVFTRVGRAGSCLLVTENEAGWIISGQTLRLRLDNPKLDNRFLFYALRSHAVQKFVLNSSVGTTRESLNTKIIESIPVLHPRHGEQHLIAEILSAVDEAIGQTEALIAKYQQIKAGLMHDLFTRGITPEGHLRPTREQVPHLYRDSPLGWIPKEWEVVRIAEAFEIQLGKMLNKFAKTGKLSAPYLGNRAVQWDAVDISAIEVMDFNAYERQKFSLLPGDLLVCEGGDVGRTAMWRGEMDGCYYQKAIHRLRPKSADALPSFMLRFMRFARDNGSFREFTSKSSIAHLTQEKLGSIGMLLPSLDEQKRIADRLDFLNGFIQTEQAKLVKLRQQKQGLMQDLLTGRVRVKVAQSGGSTT